MKDPFELFDQWYKAANAHDDVIDASAMALATVDSQGAPHVRMVLLKAASESGFVFYTNLNSPKARDLTANPKAELCFHWSPLARQIRIGGTVEPVSLEEADAYFATRPRMSQLGAWASHQSEPMESQFTLERNVAAAVFRFGTKKVPRPPHWSGFRLVPDRIEFWVQGASRLHERFVYLREADGWRREFLYP